jgi:hypothetical protein
MSTPALPEEIGPVLSEGQRLLYTFTAPSRTMADLRRSASWWVPWLLISIVSIAFAYTLDKKIGWAQVMETQIQSNPKASAQMDKMPADQRQKVLNIQVMSARIIGYAAPVTTLLALVVSAGVLLGVFNFGFGAKLHFRELLAVSAYSLLPGILNTLLIIVIMFFVESDSFDVKSPAATNAGYFVPASMPFTRGLLGAFDVFTIWQIALMAIGVSQLSKVKKGTAFVAIFGVFFVVKLVTAAFCSM